MSGGDFNFYKRLSQIGEYKYNNRLDTLFIFQLTFIFILLFIVLSYLSRSGIISTIGKNLLLFTLGVFVLVIYLNHIVVLPKIRDSNNWNRMNYGDGTYKPDNYVVGGVIGGMNGPPPTGTCTTTPASTTCTN